MTLPRSTDAVSAELPAAATLQERLDFVLEYARRGGASTAEASASASRGLNVNVRKDAIESLEFQQDRELGLTVYIGQRKGHATTGDWSDRSEEHTSELQSLMRISYAVFCLKKKTT